MTQRTIEYRQLIQIVVLFTLVQFVGLLIAIGAYSGATYENMSLQGYGLSIYTYIVVIVASIVFLMLLFKFYHGEKIFFLIEGYLILITTFYLVGIIINIPYGNAFAFVYGDLGGYSYIIPLLAGIAMIILKNKYKSLRNATAMITSLGLGLILGMTFTFQMALIFMALLAVYDFISVFVTKHMVAFANAAVKLNLAMMVSINEIEAIPEAQVDKKYIKEYEKEKKESPNKRIFEAIPKGTVPFAASTALGNGDMAMPLMVAVSAYSSFFNFDISIAVILGAILGLTLTMFILRKYKRALPAIPPLLLGICIGLGAYFILANI
ncbi:MAG: presenilin family intramembrane aspartyl protease [Candidatus Micrarchaeia archaeon]